MTDTHIHDLIHLIELYAFADEYLVTTLRSKTLRFVFDAILTTSLNHLLNYTVVALAYENTRPACGLRKLLSDCLGFKANLIWVKKAAKLIFLIIRISY